MAKWTDRAGAWFYGLQGGVVWYDDDFVDYYFGVDSSEALPGRPAYEPDSETSFRTIATLGYQRPQSPWLFLIGGRYEVYGDEVDDSPIVDDDGEAMLFGGVGYTFGR